MGPLVKGATALIGLGTEAYAHHKQKKERSKSPAPYSLSPAYSEQSGSTYGGNPAPHPQGTLAPPPSYPGGQQRSNCSGSNFSDVSATARMKTSGLEMQLKTGSWPLNLVERYGLSTSLLMTSHGYTLRLNTTQPRADYLVPS